MIFLTVKEVLNMSKNIKNQMEYFGILLLVSFTGILFCETNVQAQEPGVRIANLYDGNQTEDFLAIREKFKERNPGYDFDYLSEVKKVEARDYTQVVFIQEVEGVTNQDVAGSVTITGNSQAQKPSETIVGDIILLQEGETMQTDEELGVLIFQVPEAPENDLPSFIRPDWDPNITDVPGGCATDIDAYRRILLTWKEGVGEYIYRALNAHRVRIYDSFSHYHPVEGGFDEFYLVQITEPGAKIITSEKVDHIVNPDDVQKSQVNGLVQEYELELGDLVYLPRGVMHRGVGGVVAQVITVPGFIPGSEIGVDHHLRAINERLGLNGDEALPFNEEHSHEAVIR